MVMVVCGNFQPEKLIKEIENRLIPKEEQGEIKRIYPPKEDKINKKYKEEKMEVSIPLFAIGFKDIEGMQNKKEIVKKHIAIDILLNMLIGKSSEEYKKLYEQGDLLEQPELDYEFSNEYAHILIAGRSKRPEEVKNIIEKKIENYISEGLNKEHFERIKKKIYGDYVVEYINVGSIARMFLADSLKGIISFNYIEEFNTVT